MTKPSGRARTENRVHTCMGFSAPLLDLHSVSPVFCLAPELLFVEYSPASRIWMNPASPPSGLQQNQRCMRCTWWKTGRRQRRFFTVLTHEVARALGGGRVAPCCSFQRRIVLTHMPRLPPHAQKHLLRLRRQRLARPCHSGHIRIAWMVEPPLDELDHGPPYEATPIAKRRKRWVRRCNAR